MKNVKLYEKKLRKLLGEAHKARVPNIPRRAERVYFLIEAIIQADATRKQSAEALKALREEYVDLNEIRVSPIRDIVECMGRDYPGGQEKAQEVVNVLNNLFFKTNDLSLDYLADASKRDLKRVLLEMGLDSYAEALIRVAVFEAAAIPVDQTLLACLVKDEHVGPDAELADVQSLLERLVGPKDALGVHEMLKAYAEKQAKHLARRPVPTAAAVIPAPKPFKPIPMIAPDMIRKAAEEAARKGGRSGKPPVPTPKPQPTAAPAVAKRLSSIKKAAGKMKKPAKKADGKK